MSFATHGCGDASYVRLYYAMGLYIGTVMRSAVFDWQLVVYLAWTSWSWGAWSFPRITPSGSVLPSPCHLIHSDLVTDLFCTARHFPKCI
jgi:hypothetical protein